MRRHPSMRIASLRPHWSLPDTSLAVATERANPTKRSKDLWGWVQEDAAADAFLRALTAPDGAWVGHERFFVVAPTIACEGAVDTAELRARWYPDVPVRNGCEIKGKAGFFDCRKAERVLGWSHPV